MAEPQPPLTAEELRREQVEIDIARELFRKEPTHENYLALKRLLMRALRRRRRTTVEPTPQAGISRQARSMLALRRRLDMLKEREARKLERGG